MFVTPRYAGRRLAGLGSLQAAEVDDPDPVAQALGLLHVVGRVHDRHPGAARWPTRPLAVRS